MPINNPISHPHFPINIILKNPRINDGDLLLLKWKFSQRRCRKLWNIVENCENVDAAVILLKKSKKIFSFYSGKIGKKEIAQQ